MESPRTASRLGAYSPRRSRRAATLFLPPPGALSLASPLLLGDPRLCRRRVFLRRRRRDRPPLCRRGAGPAPHAIQSNRRLGPCEFCISHSRDESQRDLPSARFGGTCSRGPPSPRCPAPHRPRLLAPCPNPDPRRAAARRPSEPSWLSWPRRCSSSAPPFRAGGAARRATVSLVSAWARSSSAMPVRAARAICRGWAAAPRPGRCSAAWAARAAGRRRCSWSSPRSRCWSLAAAAGPHASAGSPPLCR